MPRHDPPESQPEADERVERELRGLMAKHDVTHILDLPHDVIRETVRLSRDAPAVHHRILLERLPGSQD